MAYLAARAFGAGWRSGVSAHDRAGRRLGLLAGLGSMGLMALSLAAPPWLGVQVSAPIVLANAALSMVLVRGCGGLPPLGLMGAGIGSAVPYLLGLASYAWLLGHRLALAGVLIWLLGVTALYMVPPGLAAAVAIRLSQAVGAGRPAALWTLAKAGLLVGLFGAGVARLFKPDPAIMALSATLFLSLALMQVADGLQTVSLGALRDLLDGHWPARASLVPGLLLAGGAAGRLDCLAAAGAGAARPLAGIRLGPGRGRRGVDAAPARETCEASVAQPGKLRPMTTRTA